MSTTPILSGCCCHGTVVARRKVGVPLHEVATRGLPVHEQERAPACGRRPSAPTAELVFGLLLSHRTLLLVVGGQGRESRLGSRAWLVCVLSSLGRLRLRALRLPTTSKEPCTDTCLSLRGAVGGPNF